MDEVNKAIIPDKLMPIIRAFSADEQGAKLLILEAAKAIGLAEKSDDYIFDKRAISKEELEGIISLMKALEPRNYLETIYCAQIVVSHISGIRFLSHSHDHDRALGMKFLKFGNEAMVQLQKKRGGGSCR